MSSTEMFVTVKGPGFEKDFSALSISEAVEKAVDWIKTAPEQYGTPDIMMNEAGQYISSMWMAKNGRLLSLIVW